MPPETFKARRSREHGGLPDVLITNRDLPEPIAYA